MGALSSFRNFRPWKSKQYCRTRDVQGLKSYVYDVCSVGEMHKIIACQSRQPCSKRRVTPGLKNRLPKIIIPKEADNLLHVYIGIMRGNM